MSVRKKKQPMPIDRNGLIRLTLAAFAGLWLVRAAVGILPMPWTPKLLLRAAGLLLLGMTAVMLCRRFCVSDERGRLPGECLNLWELPAGYLHHLILLGAALPFPVLFLSSLISAAAAKVGVTIAPAAGFYRIQFLPALLVSGVLAPVCEELFFRGWLTVLCEEKEDGTRIPDWEVWCFSAALFALAHGLDVMFPVRFLLGLLLCKLMREMNSLLAPIVVHMGYNMVLLILEGAGVYGMFSNPHPMGTLISILLSFAALYQIRWVLQGRLTGIDPVELKIGKLTFWGYVLIISTAFYMFVCLFWGMFL